MTDRKTFIGGSDVAAILGVHPYRSALEVWGEKTGKFTPDDEEIKAKPAVAWGNRLEAAIADHWTARNGDGVISNEIEPREIQHPAYPYLRGHVDRLVARTEVDPVYPLEIKTAGIRQADRWAVGSPSGPDGYTPEAVPIEYYLQAQYYAWLMNASHCAIAVLIAGQDYRDYRYPADTELWEQFGILLPYFWTEHVLKLDPPQPVFRDSPYLAKLFDRVNEETLLADNETTATVYAVADLKRRVKMLKETIDQGEAAIKLAMGEHQYLVDSTGTELVTWKQHQKKQFRAKNFTSDQPALAAQYTDTLMVRQLRFKLKGDEDDET